MKPKAVAVPAAILMAHPSLSPSQVFDPTTASAVQYIVPTAAKPVEVFVMIGTKTRTYVS